jgi:hypothetical protein
VKGGIPGMELNDIIKDRLKTKGRNQQYLVDSIEGMKKSALSRYLNENRKIPLPVIIAVLDTLNCSLQVRDNETGEIINVTTTTHREN